MIVQIRSKEVIRLYLLILFLKDLSTSAGLLFNSPNNIHMKPWASQSESNAHICKERAIVVGGGPVGLSAALMLANRGYDVSLFEATSAKEINIFNPALAYMYNINERGQVFTKMFPNIHKTLVERSVASIDTGWMLAPGDIEKEIQFPKLPNMGPKSYWIPRHAMTALLWDAVNEHNTSSDDNSLVGRIDYEQGVNCVSVHPSNDLENRISVVVKNKNNGKEKTVDGKLVVGADGIDSKVRECLQEQTGLFGSWHYRRNKFKIRKWVSPATGLKFKALQLPANRYTIEDSNGKNVLTKNTDFISVYSRNDGPLDRLSISSLPLQDSNTIRPGNCITRPTHVLWAMTTGAEVKVWFKDNYPRFTSILR